MSSISNFKLNSGSNKLKFSNMDYMFKSPTLSTTSAPIKSSRGTLDRILGVLGNGSIAQGLYNMTDDDPSTTFGQGVKEGIEYMNPFKDDVSGRKSFSDVLKNVGWTDSDPTKISGSDVGRGITGFVGDVLLDPLTFINPLGAASKVVKGSGVAADGVKALTKMGVINDVSDLTKGKVGLSKLSKLTDLTVDDAKEVIKGFGDNVNLSDELLTAKTTDFLNRYADHVQHVKDIDNDPGLYMGLNYASKKKSGDKIARTLYKTIVSNDKLQRLGDNTIAPYYNTLAKKVRISSLGQKFSKSNVLEAVADKEGTAESFKKFYTDHLLKAVENIPKDVNDIEVADHLEKYWKGLTKDEQYAWIDNYENGDFNNAHAFLKFKASIQDAAEKNGIKADGLFATVEGKNSTAKKMVDEAATHLRKFLDVKKTELYHNDGEHIEKVFGKPVTAMSDQEVITSMRYVDKMKNPKITYKDLMHHYNESTSKFAEVRGKLKDYHTDTDAYNGFLALDPESKNGLVNSFYKANTENLNPALTVDNIMKDTTVSPVEKTVETPVKDVPVEQETSAFTNPDQSAFYKKIDSMLGGGYISDVSDVAKQLDSIKNGFKTEGKFDQDALDVSKLVSDRMETIAEKEVSRGLLTRAQADAMKGKYLLHISTEEKSRLNSILHDDNGQFNPDVLGIMKGFDENRTLKTINGANSEVDKVTGEIIYKEKAILEDSLSEIYLTRCLASNKLVFGTDAQNFIKHNFGTVLNDGDTITHGFSAVIPFKDIQGALKKNAAKLAAEDMKSAIDEAPSLVEKQAVEAAYIANKDERIDEAFKGLINSFSGGDKDFVTKFSPNVSMQELTAEQIKQAKLLGLEPFQIQKNILDRTNILSRTQKLEMSNSMLNLFDKMQNIWKLQNTIITPGFHIQNSISNAFQSFLGVGADALDMTKLKKAYDVISMKDPKQYVTLGGVKYSYKQLEYIAKKTGVIDELFHEFEFKAGTSDGLLKNTKIPKSLDPTNTTDFFAYKLGTKVGTQIEATQRMNLFMSALDKGDNVEEATARVNKFLFDYGELTDFEQNVMKRVIPFYTFMKKNIPMELEQMLAQPTTFTGVNRAMTNISKMNESAYQDENDRNSWRQGSVQLPTGSDGVSYGLTPNLPYTQLERILSPNKLAGQITPAIKTPIEAITGKQLYTGMPITSPLDYVAQQTAVTKLIDMAMKKPAGKERDLYIAGQLAGMPVNTMGEPTIDFSQYAQQDTVK